MLATLWSWFISLFSKEKIGILFILLFKSGMSSLASYIADINFQRKALEYVKDLARDSTLTNAQKAAKFNEKMFEYGKKFGKVLCESVLNCLRELAVTAMKAELGR